jgi:SAM-dependent methyltransferase
MNNSDATPDRRKSALEIPVGAVQFGDFQRLSPIGRDFGYERGTPVDRYYIEGFLARNAGDVCGRVLELASNDYTYRFGADRVAHSDVLDLNATNPNATLVGDLTRVNTLPEAAFDCIIFTQALQYIYDTRTAVEMLHRALKENGVLLATAPAISGVDVWPWYWTFTAPALHRLLEERFGPSSVTAEAHGNILAATAFLYGLGYEELDSADLKQDDPKFAVTIAARAVKRADRWADAANSENLSR